MAAKLSRSGRVALASLNPAGRDAGLALMRYLIP